MDRSWLIHVIVFICSFDLFCSILLKNEYIYTRVAESYNTTTKTSSCSNKSAGSSIDILVTSEVSRWTLLLNVTILLPASIASVFITTLGDRIGRKPVLAIPILGTAVGELIMLLIVYFDWSLYVFYACNFVSGLSGFYTAMLTQGCAFLGDITNQENRGRAFVLLETSVGIGGGVAGVVGGLWLNASGFLQPILCTLLLQLIALVTIVFLPNSTIMRQQKETISSTFCQNSSKEKSNVFSQIAEVDSITGQSKPAPSSKSLCSELVIFSLLRSAWRVYSSDFSRCGECHVDDFAASDSLNHSQTSQKRGCVHKGTGFPGRTWRLWLYLVVDNFFMFVLVGSSEAQTVYYLSEPLCFSPPLLGGQIGLKFSLFAISPLVVFLFEKLFSLQNNSMILIGVAAMFSCCLIISFATSPFLVYIGTLPMVFVNLTRPFVMTQISNMVLDSEIGSAFALFTSTETAAYLLGSVSFLEIYPATKSFYNGFMWIFGALVLVVPINLMLFVIKKDKRKVSYTDEERRPLLS